MSVNKREWPLFRVRCVRYERADPFATKGTTPARHEGASHTVLRARGAPTTRDDMASLAAEAVTVGNAARCWPPTRRVVIFGLVGRADLNGREGTLMPRRGPTDLPDIRLPVLVRGTDEAVLVRPRNLKAAIGVELLGDDELQEFFMRVDPAMALAMRLVCTSWCAAVSTLFCTAAWQSAHLPFPALCCASAWAGARARLLHRPDEARLSSRLG